MKLAEFCKCTPRSHGSDVLEREKQDDGADQQRVDEGTIKSMPQKVRNRIIELRAKKRVARNRLEIKLQKQSVCWQTCRTVEVAPFKGCGGLGGGHDCFALEALGPRLATS